MDVYGIGTDNGTPVKHDYYNGGANQQFKLKRVTTEANVYEIIPLHAQDKRIDITGGSTANDTLVQIYQSNSTASQRFKIVDDGNGTGSFKILTGNTGYTKCITNQWASLTPTNVIQYGYGNNGINDNDHWYFEKIDEIGVNQERNVNIGRNSYNLFYISFNKEYIFQNVTYIIETVGSKDTMMELYFNGQYEFGNDDGGEGLNARIVFTPNNVDGITVKVKMYGTGSGNAQLRLRPQNQIYANSYNADGDIDTREDIYSVYDDFNKLDLYVNHSINSSPIRNEEFRSNPIMNNRFYFISAHGGNGSVTYAPGHSFGTGSLPIMLDVELVVWAVCHGADAPSGGVSMVQKSISNGAQYALGWHGVTYVGTSRTFTTFLWENIGNGQAIGTAVENAISSTRRHYWIKEIFGWGDDPVLSPVLQSATKGLIVSASPSSKVIYKGIPLLLSDSYLKDEKDYQQYIMSENKQIYLKKINGILTNEITVIEKDAIGSYTKKVYNNSYDEVKNVDLSRYHNSSAIIENFFYLNIDGEYHLIQRTQVKDNDNLTEIYYDITMNKYLTEEFVMSSFCF